MKFSYFIRNLRLPDAAGLLPVTVLTIFFSHYVVGNTVDFTSTILVSVVMTAYLLYALTINNYFDRENDKNNREKIMRNPVASGDMSPMQGFLAANVFLIAGMTLTALWLPEIFVVYLLFMTNAFLYSYKFKSKPVLDIVSHAFYVLALFIVPAILLNFDTYTVAAGSAMVFFLSTVIQLENEIGDFNADKKAGAMTTAVRFGTKKSKIVYYICGVALIASALLLYGALGDYRILIFIPLAAASLIRLDSRLVRRKFGSLSVAYVVLSMLFIALS